MPYKIAVTGFGRIGRAVVRALYELDRSDEFQVVGINDLAPAETLAHLLKYDSTHGIFSQDVSLSGENLLKIGGDEIRLFAEKDPAQIPWGELGVDLLLDCSGAFRTREKASRHLQSGVPRVLLSAPAGDEVDATVVFGVNQQVLRRTHQIVSNASCTTNCLAVLLKPLVATIGIESGLLHTVHAYTGDQNLVDTAHKDLHRARAAGVSMIPTKTGATDAVGLVIPELAGRLQGFAMRVPTLNVSVCDMTFVPSRATSVEEINELLQVAADGEMKGLLEINQAPLVSIDFNHNSASAVYDQALTKVSADGRLVKLMAWYDNEWGYSCRMLDMARAWLES
ncbi:MAG: type I glyceraldehyde-3-phosphate dehydrogenase [Gammaproteobacteria bacterium]|nr:type I glyceraldehyde-3-phosphate dehydrogenase [Gammaproteobacteria bacterium]